MLYRDSWIEVDLDAVSENIRTIQAMNQKKLIAVIKANGYGAGAREIAEAAVSNGIEMLAVSSLDEAVDLRKGGITCGILILGAVNPEHAAVLRDYDLSATVVSAQWARQFASAGKGCKVHLKADTGMNRIGLKDPQEMKEIYQLLKKNGIQIEGIFSHLACAEAEDNAANEVQAARFEEFLSVLETKPEWIHLKNSDGIVNFSKDDSCNASRAGLAIMGMCSFPNQLRPVMALKCRIICVKKLKAGEHVGYGWTYTAQKEEWIATIPIGYADGWNRRNQGRSAIVNGQECEFVGRICMDQAMLRVPKGTKEGDIAELFGPALSIEKAAAELGTIPYEVMTALTDRLTRVYYKDGKMMKTVNLRFDAYRK